MKLKWGDCNEMQTVGCCVFIFCELFVTVSIEPAGKNVSLKITDSGPGIPEELHSRIFERFFRVVGSASPGSGLGLSIVQQIAQLHHAEIHLSTPPSGKGLQIEVLFVA